MNGGCSKCGGEGRVMVQDEGTHWHWEACPDCNGLEEMALTGGVTYDSWGAAPPWTIAVDTELNDDLHDNLPW